MKKILLTLISCFLLVGCGNKEIDLNNINDSLLNLKDNNELVFKDVEKKDNEYLKNLYSIDASLATEILYVETTDPNEVDLYIILKTDSEDLLEQIDTRFEALELQCEMYSPDNALKVKNRLETTYNGYNIYIVSDNNNLVLDTIKGA